MIERESKIELKIKASRFIGETRIVSSIDQADSALQSIRKREHAATHHCYAYKLQSLNQPLFKYSDDGEPSGTAGRPIFDAIEGRKLTNLLVVVTRYFGGTKLGTGGLVRAYGDTTAGALDVSGIIEKYVMKKFKLGASFSTYNILLRLFEKLKVEVCESSFSSDVTLIVRIRQSNADQLKAEFVEITSGKGTIDEVR